MRQFVAEQNIRHFKRILESETDPSRRAIVTELLAQAEFELAAAEGESAEIERVAQAQDAVSTRKAVPGRVSRRMV